MATTGYGKPIDDEEVRDDEWVDPNEDPNEFSEVGDIDVRCSGCNKLLARLVTRPWLIECHRCKTVNQQPVP